MVDGTSLCDLNRCPFSKGRHTPANSREGIFNSGTNLCGDQSSLLDHRDDIPALAQVLWKKIAGPDSPALPADMAAELESFPWPGNVRELKSLLATLHAMFGAYRLDVDRLLLLMRLPGRHTARKSAPAGGEPGLHQIECLRHLRRAVESIRACKVAVRLVLHPATKQSRAALHAVSDALCTHLVQLEQLCLRSEFFVLHETFATVGRFKGPLFVFNEQLLKAPHQVRDQWKAELDSTYDSTLAAAMAEIQRLAVTHLSSDPAAALSRKSVWRNVEEMTMRTSLCFHNCREVGVFFGIRCDKQQCGHAV